MTDRKPDDLYDALRDRLADYGQEPPAPLWAGIRAQLPPPVAPPQLRRRRRWSPVLLLGLLLAVVAGAAWQWWHGAAPGQSAARTGQVAANGKRGDNSAAASAPQPASADVTEAAELGQASTATHAATNTATSAQVPALAAAKDAPPTTPQNKGVASSKRSATIILGRRPSATEPGTLVVSSYEATHSKPTTLPSNIAAGKQGFGAGIDAKKVAVLQKSVPEARKSTRQPVDLAEALAAGASSTASQLTAFATSPAQLPSENQSQSLANSSQAGIDEAAPATQSSKESFAAASSLLRRTPAL